MNDLSAQQRFIAALRDSARYPYPVKHVTVIETHISWVLLAGRFAYKIKKAVNLGFLDFTTLAQRRLDCEEELRLNRRMAPQLYLDVIAIGGTPQSPQFGAEPVIEYAVQMRRFPATRLMDRRLRAGKLAGRHIDALAAVLARFHAGLSASAADTDYGTVAAIRSAAMENFASLAASLDDSPERSLLAGLQAATEAELARCAPVFAERLAQGFVRECHGDLHLGNIVLQGDAPLPFDCIEFNPSFRWIDVASETAFTMMDLLYRGQSPFAWRFINGYLEHSGDYSGVAVLRFYLAYRAMVRAKVAAIRARQSGQSKRAIRKEFEECREHLALAGHCLARPQPVMVITHGLPGCGKSTFAQMAVERYGAIRIRSDVERKRLFGLAPLENSRSALGDGIYGPEATRQTYARLQELAQQILAAGYTVIVDAAFLRQSERAQFSGLAQRLGVPFVIASVEASDAVLQARIVQRHAAGRDASEADLAVLATLQTAQERLSPQEQALSVGFRNDTADELAVAPGWEKLDRLCGAQQFNAGTSRSTRTG